MVVVRRCLVIVVAFCFMAGCNSGKRGEPQQDADSPPSVEVPSAGLPGEAPERSTANHGISTVDPVGSEPMSQPAGVEQAAPDRAATIAERLPLDSPWKTWAESLTGGDPESRRSAADAIAQAFAPFAPAEVATLLTHPSPYLRRCAAFYLLDRFDPNESEAVDAMAGALSDDDATVRHIALSAIRRLPMARLATVLPHLTAMLTLQREDATNRAAIVRLIASLERRGDAALPLLTEILRTDPDSSVRSAAAVAIPRMTEPAQAADRLRQALADESDPAVQMVLVARLGRLGPSSAVAVDELSQALKTADTQLQRRVIDAMIAIGRPSVPRLIDQLASPDVQLRRLAVFALGSLGPAASEAAEPLRACLNDPDAEVRQLAELALSRIASSR